MEKLSIYIEKLSIYQRYIAFIVFMVIVWIAPALLHFIFDYLFGDGHWYELIIYPAFFYLFGTWYAAGHLFNVKPADWGFEGYKTNTIAKKILIQGGITVVIGSGTLLVIVSPFLALIYGVRPEEFFEIF